MVFIGSNEPINTSSSIKEEQYESDLLEEEKVAADGKLIYYKGKQIKHEEPNMRSRSPIRYPELDIKPSY